ncbi:MAG: heavy metal translocating P-type ATPase [Candidatus Ozemobacteraceae bacterium]
MNTQDISATSGQELFLAIGGMSCVNCSRALEKGLSATPGILQVRVYLADESAELLFDAKVTSPQAITARISELGYQGRPLGTPIEEETDLGALLFAAVLALPTASLAMFAADTWPNRFTQMVLSGLLLMTVGKRFFTGAIRALKARSANMDVLVSLGIGTSWIYSTGVMIVQSHAAAATSPVATAAHYAGGMIHFEAAALLVLFILFGKRLETSARRRASQGLRDLTSLQLGTARRITRDGTEETVDSALLAVGDRVRIVAGERFPTDGEVMHGETTADESLLTGESMPVSKTPGQPVISGSVNLTSEVTMRVLRSGAESTLQSLIRVVRRAQADKPSVQRFADRAAEVFVPAVVTLSLLTFSAWFLATHEVAPALMHAVAVLVVACPCALGLATPTAIVIATDLALKRGLLVKKPSALEALADIRFLLIDKTGTLTKGEPEVRHLEFPGAAAGENLLSVAAALSSASVHPLAKSIAIECARRGAKPTNLLHMTERRGFGLSGKDASGREYFLGSAALLADQAIVEPSLSDIFAKEALTPVFFADEDVVLAVFGLADAPRPESRSVIAALRERGITPVMVSGDRWAPARAIAAECGIDADQVRAEILPTGKLEVVREFLAHGSTAFVGDGINDAPALGLATVGVAIGSGAEAAQESVDLILVRRDLFLLPFAIDLARATLAKIRQNIGWAMVYNLLSIPLAAGVLVPFLGPKFSLTPTIAGLAMAFSSVSVVTNSLLLKRAHFLK